MKLFDLVRQRASRLSGRSRAVGFFFATSLGARALGIGCQLLQVPLAMRALGSEAFGLWMTLTSIGNVIAFADFGVGQGAQNKLAEAFASERREAARELWDTTLVFFGAVGLVLAVVALGLSRTIDVVSLFNLIDPGVQREARSAVDITLFLFCLGFPLGLAQRLAYSRQLGWMHNVVLAFASAGSLVGVAWAAHQHWRLPALIAVSQVPVLLGNAGLMLWQLGQLGWSNVGRLRWNPSAMRDLIGLGAYFGIQQAQLVMFISLPQVIISTNLGAAAVTPYNLAQRFFNLFAVAQNAFMLPLWPAYSDAHARKDFAWIRRTLFLSLGATALLTLLPMAVGAMFAQPVLGAWVGNAAALPSAGLIWLLYFWNAAMFIEQPFGYLLAGISEVKRLTFYSVVSAGASICLMFLLVHEHGQEGVVLGMIIGFMPFLLFGNIAEIVRVFRLFPGQGDAAPPLMNPAPQAPTQS
jgi:O-antigen/teichoic acid export membrane protein